MSEKRTEIIDRVLSELTTVAITMTAVGSLFWAFVQPAWDKHFTGLMDERHYATKDSLDKIEAEVADLQNKSVETGKSLEYLRAKADDNAISSGDMKGLLNKMLLAMINKGNNVGQ